MALTGETLRITGFLTTVSGISFVSIRRTWQKNSSFLIYFKRLSYIIGRMACLIIINNPFRRDVLTKQMPVVLPLEFGLAVVRPSRM